MHVLLVGALTLDQPRKLFSFFISIRSFSSNGSSSKNFPVSRTLQNVQSRFEKTPESNVAQG
jgi:hypothetical protein